MRRTQTCAGCGFNINLDAPKLYMTRDAAGRQWHGECADLAAVGALKPFVNRGADQSPRGDISTERKR